MSRTSLASRTRIPPAGPGLIPALAPPPNPPAALTVPPEGVTIKPGLSLGGYAAFAKDRDGAMLMGDLVVTEAELPKVTDALQKAGIEQTALHKHLLAQHPDIWWTHVHAMGDPVT